MALLSHTRRLAIALLAAGAATGWAAIEPAPGPVAPPLPELGISFLRLLGALALVIALCLAGAWLFRNGQRLAHRGRRPSKLSLLEVKPLGQRLALYVVAYERQRLLLGASPTGVTLISQLPDATPAQPDTAPSPGSFDEQLFQRAVVSLSPPPRATPPPPPYFGRAGGVASGP